MSVLPLLRVAEIPEPVEEETAGARTLCVLDDVEGAEVEEDDDDDAAVNRLGPARGALFGIVLGAVFWTTFLVLLIKR